MSFQGILRQFLQATPAAIGAIFLDQTGEAVEFWAERPFDIGADGLRAVGAYQGIYIDDLNRICKRIGAGKVERVVIDFEHAKVISCNLKEGYYLVVIADHDFNEGILWQRLSACRDRLLHEL